MLVIIDPFANDFYRYYQAVLGANLPDPKGPLTTLISRQQAITEAKAGTRGGNCPRKGETVTLMQR